MDEEERDALFDDLKALLGSPDGRDDQIDLILRMTRQKVLNDTRQDFLPNALAPVLVEMAADAFRLNDQADGTAGAGEVVGTVSSISDHGQSVSYRDSSYQTVLSAVASVVRDYRGQLDRYRKVGW